MEVGASQGDTELSLPSLPVKLVSVLPMRPWGRSPQRPRWARIPERSLCECLGTRRLVSGVRGPSLESSRASAAAQALGTCCGKDRMCTGPWPALRGQLPCGQWPELNYLSG